MGFVQAPYKDPSLPSPCHSSPSPRVASSLSQRSLLPPACMTTVADTTPSAFGRVSDQYGAVSPIRVGPAGATPHASASRSLTLFPSSPVPQTSGLLRADSGSIMRSGLSSSNLLQAPALGRSITDPSTAAMSPAGY